MCLAAFALRAHPRFPLVVATNRDEFYARPTRAAGWWADAASPRQVWAGRDEQGGGTWMGVTRAGRFALLTNVREPAHHRAGPATRGALVAGFLESDAAPDAYLARVAQTRAAYNGFNLVCGALGVPAALWALHHGHDQADRAGQVEVLGAGVHGLSNAAFGTPWPKTTGLARDTTDALRQHGDPHRLAGSLFAALADPARAPDHALPDTGVGLDWERRLSARFIAEQGIVGAEYGTRASTVLIVQADGTVQIEERAFGPGGVALGRQRAAWRLA